MWGDFSIELSIAHRDDARECALDKKSVMLQAGALVTKSEPVL